MNAAKSQLGLHADCRVMARCLTRPSSFKGNAPSRIPEDLRHGDTLFFFVLEKDLAASVDAGDGDGAVAASPFSRTTKLRKAKKEVVGLSSRASAVTVPPEVTRAAQPVLGDTVEEKAAAKGFSIPAA